MLYEKIEPVYEGLRARIIDVQCIRTHGVYSYRDALVQTWARSTRELIEKLAPVPCPQIQAPAPKCCARVASIRDAYTSSESHKYGA
jgi:hypothetical protein